MNSPTLNQIEKILKDILSKMATKDDLKSIEDNINKKLSNFATKNDLKQLRKQIKEDIAQASMDVFKSADKNKAEKEDLEKLEKRVDQIEESLQVSPL